MTIRKATTEDCEALAQLCVTTFTDTYAAQNTKENLQDYLTKSFNTEQLTEELQDPNSAYFLLLDDRMLIGYIKLNYNCPPDGFDGAENWMEIQRIYVLKAHQQRGLGKLLLQYAMERGQASGAAYLWLGVWEKNEKAIQFYKKHGYKVISTHVFVLGKDAQTDYVMQSQLLLNNATHRGIS